MHGKAGKENRKKKYSCKQYDCELFVLNEPVAA